MYVLTDGSLYPLNRYGTPLQCILQGPGWVHNYFGKNYHHPPMFNYELWMCYTLR